MSHGHQNLESVSNVERNNFTKCDYHLILIDNIMPVMDGCDSSIKIRTYLKEKGILQPIIICVTGQTEDSYVQKAYRSGINGVSDKPVNI